MKKINVSNVGIVLCDVIENGPLREQDFPDLLIKYCNENGIGYSDEYKQWYDEHDYLLAFDTILDEQDVDFQVNFVKWLWKTQKLDMWF